MSELIRLAPQIGGRSIINEWPKKLSVSGKVAGMIVLERMKGALEEVLREGKVGLRVGRGGTHQILVLKKHY